MMHLDLDCWQCILPYLGLRDLRVLSCTNRTFRVLCAKPRLRCAAYNIVRSRRKSQTRTKIDFALNALCSGQSDWDGEVTFRRYGEEAATILRIPQATCWWGGESVVLKETVRGIFFGELPRDGDLCDQIVVMGIGIRKVEWYLRGISVWFASHHLSSSFAVSKSHAPLPLISCPWTHTGLRISADAVSGILIRYIACDTPIRRDLGAGHLLSKTNSGEPVLLW